MAAWRQQALIEAPVREVWEILSDPSRGPDWSENVIAVTGAPVEIEKGSTFELTTRGPLRLKNTTTFEVEELVDLHELKMRCQYSGYYTHWRLTDAQGSTFAELELGVEPKPGIEGRAVSALHTKSFLRRQVESLLDGLRRVVVRERGGAT